MNTCNCDNPPGGSVTCNDDQIPVCRVVNGATHGYCLSPPSNLSGLELTAWFFSDLLRREVTTGEVLSRREFQAALQDGRFINRETGEIITFRVPEGLNLRIPAVAGMRA
jgi:hypothetical protein